MQALSQLSYGPTMLEAEFYAAVKDSPSLLCDIATKIRWFSANKKPRPRPGLFALQLASPRGFEPRSPP